MNEWIEWMSEWMNATNIQRVRVSLYGGSSIKTWKTKNPVNIGIKCKHNATETDSKCCELNRTKPNYGEYATAEELWER